MAGLTKVKGDSEYWGVIISGNVEQRLETKGYTVTGTEMQPDSDFFKALVLIQALYDHELMDYNEHAYSNLDRALIELSDMLKVELPYDYWFDNARLLRDFIDDWFPLSGDNIFRWKYPKHAIDISIFDGKGQKYKLTYDEADVIDALKTYKLVK